MREHVVQDVIRKYFRPVQKDVSLPNPHGPLSSKVPPGAIEAANDRVSETIKPSRSSSGNTSNTARGPYTKLTPAQRLMIEKQASEHGTTLTILHSTAPRQLQSRGQVRNKRNNETVGFAKVFFPITLEMQFRQSFLLCLYGI